MRQRIVAVALAVVALFGTMAAVTAQEASPETPVRLAEPTEASFSLTGLDDALRMAQAEQRASSDRWYAAIAAQVAASRAQRVRQAVSAAPSAPVYADGGTAWDRIAQCESGGDWSKNTRNGYYGGLQMDMNFWNTYASRVTITNPDGTTTDQLVAPRPDLASREEQIAAAERARDSGRGYGPWPVCGRRA